MDIEKEERGRSFISREMIASISENGGRWMWGVDVAAIGGEGTENWEPGNGKWEEQKIQMLKGVLLISIYCSNYHLLFFLLFFPEINENYSVKVFRPHLSSLINCCLLIFLVAQVQWFPSTWHIPIRPLADF